MWVRMLRDWKNWRANRILDIPDGQANVMIRRHICEATIDPASVVREAADAGRSGPRKPEAKRVGNSRL